MTLSTSIRHGAAWLFVGKSSNQIIGFVCGIILARLLVPEDFGTLITVQVFTGLAGFIAGGGMGQALVRAKEVSAHDYDIVFTLQFTVGCVIYACFFAAAPWFAKWYDRPLFADLLRVSALSFMFRPFVNLPSSILHRNMHFKALTGVRVSALLLTNGVSICMALLGYGVWSLVCGGIAGAISGMFLLIPLAKWRPKFSSDIRRGRDIARYGMLVSVTDVLWYLRNQTSVFILSRTLGPASVGLYNKGESLAQMPHQFITASVYDVLFRAMAKEQDNLDKCRYLFFRSIGLVALYATPFYIGLLWLAEPLVRGFYGPKWLEAASPLFILAFAWPFWLMDNLSGAVLAAKNWLGREVLVQASGLIVTCLTVLIGVSYGVKGVAYAIVGTYMYSALYMYWLAAASLNARWLDFVRALIPAATLNAILACVLCVVSYTLPADIRSNDLLYLMAMGVAGGVVYGLCFLYLPISAMKTEQQRWKAKLRLPT